MLKEYHRQILERAVGERFSPSALKVVVRANLRQDNLPGQVGHPEYHFDNSAFEAGNAYLEAQRDIIRDTVRRKKDIRRAWRAFGRLTHAAQDFYAHSNYVRLWAARLTPQEGISAMRDINPLDEAILTDQMLHSGKVYWQEVISFIPALRPLASRILPPDSHAAMNLDEPGRGPLFVAAMAAARKRTVYELERLLAEFSPEEQARFLGQNQD